MVLSPVSDGYVPALGFARLTPFYDAMLAVATRERTWRGALADRIAPGAGDTILDVGCGTGTLAILLKQRAPGARVIGIDPDPAALLIAARKATSAGVEVEWRRGFARDAASVLGPGGADKAVSSLVFHQVPVPEKRAGVAAMFSAIRPGGWVHIADYARQRGLARRSLFTAIGLLDGFENTRPNANGMLERLLSEAAGEDVAPGATVETITGAISLFACRRPELERKSA
ncbi:MAG: hypothetical protein B7Z07_01780 [Sphingomonadales bacterium 32-67-7]|jgi:SAM-dependent methyltransferase|nr:MAG: hypothetical protein B7Z07_01780 [Sphingomonadales bacterium 32-67-7]